METRLPAAMEYTQIENEWKKSQRRHEYELELARGFRVAEHYLTQGYLDYFSREEVIPFPNEILNLAKYRVYEITKIVYDPNEQINDKLISVYSAMYNIDSTMAIILQSGEKDVHFYLATTSEDPDLSAGELEASLIGNFPGIDMNYMGKERKENIWQGVFGNDIKSMATVSLVPSTRDDDKKEFVQGLEKLINGMSGKEYTAVFLATPVFKETLIQRGHGFEQLYSTLSPHEKISLSYANSKSMSVSEGISNSFSKSMNHSVSESNGRNQSNSSGYNSGTNQGSNYGDGFGGWSSGSSAGSFDSYASGSSFSRSVSDSTGTSETDGRNKGQSETSGVTDTTTLTHENKGVRILMDKAELQLKRINESETFGMWECCSYFFSQDIAVTIMAANMYKALMGGNESSVENAHINWWGISKSKEINKIMMYLRHMKHPVARIPAYGNYSAQTVTPTNMIGGKELPMFLGFPRKSVNGLAVVEMAEFGRAVVFEDIKRVKRTIDFGSIYHMGVEVKKMRVPMNVDLFASHCFITGSSGSGKSYATYELLDSLLKQDVKMLVIEPAKGEYKQVFGGLKGIRIYTTDTETYKLLRINPFQFPDNIHVLSHIEKLMSIFNASWSLTAAMPAILKESVVQAYIRCGWDIQRSIWIPGVSKTKYPVFRDILDILPQIIDTSNYSANSKGDYKGALLTRLQTMTTGMAGLIFEQSEGVSDRYLFDFNTVIDLSEIGAEDTIALIMGVMIMKLGEYRTSVRKRDGGRDSDLRHVTVLEEAHNILKRCSKEQGADGGNMIGKSVEMISNSIKEMRTFGEGFIIIDQSPMAVDSSAIENTSTKIIMNTPAKDACDELSSALSLNDGQAAELSRLNTGVAAVFQKGWLTPVLMKVDMWSNDYEANVQKAKPEEMKMLRGQLTVELLNQNRNNRYSAINLRKIVRASDVLPDKKKDFEEILNKLADILDENNNKLDSYQLGEILIDIINCDGLFNIFPGKGVPSKSEYKKELLKHKEEPEFPGKYNKINRNRVKAWLKMIIKALEYYVILDNQKDCIDVIFAMLTYRTKNGEEDSSLTMVQMLMKAMMKLS